ncbi:hypothetical protein ACFE04_021970 [Oxalis oulophora]
MNDIGNSDRSKPWNIYTSSDSSSSSQAALNHDRPWRSFGTSMNAISFGFVATAILISMFLIMAIFEHLFRPTSYSSPEEATSRANESGSAKLRNLQQTGAMSYASDYSVLMPGQQYPTYIAQPAPLPCTREGIYFPCHDQIFEVQITMQKVLVLCMCILLAVQISTTEKYGKSFECFECAFSGPKRKVESVIVLLLGY